MNALEVNQLTKKYGDFIAVDNVTFAVQEGEIFGFLGPNGAGKSTTINMIASLLRPTKGEIAILGKNIARYPGDAKSNIGIVPQDIAIYEDMTAYENVSFFAGLYGLRGKELRDRTIEALEFVGLSDKVKAYPKNFSGGMKRRLNIACAIAHRPKLIIMDEPTVGIDPQSRSYILGSVKKLGAMGCTIIYTSHYMEEVEDICTRIAIIDHGKIIAEGTKEQLRAIVTHTNAIRLDVKAAGPLDLVSLRTIPGVNTVEAKDGQLLIQSDMEVNNLNRILRELMENEVEIRALESEEPNLETVFLSLTGRNLRDE